jgi:DNA repair protein RadD
LKLRPYQTDIIESTRKLMLAGRKSMVLCSPTGSGKTALTAHMLGTSSSRGIRSLFLVHRRELIRQSMRTFDTVGVRYGVIARGFAEDPRSLVQIASVQTLSRRLHLQKPPGLIVYDEAHHTAAGTWNKIYKAFPDAYHIGLTATPERTDGKGLRDWFSEIVHGPSVEWLIEEGFLVGYKLFAPGTVDLSHVKKYMGDFKQSEVVREVDKPTITGSAIREYLKTSSGKRAVVFCASIGHSKHVVEQFRSAGISAAHVDGETDPAQRDSLLKSFAENRIKVLSNVELFGEGFDLPELDCVIMLRPTHSLGLYLQQVGRVLRPNYKSGYDLSTTQGRLNAIKNSLKPYAVILDHVGNVERHGLPDELRKWSLDGRDARKSKSTASEMRIRICEQCFAALPPALSQCPHCLFVFERTGRTIEETEGELVEIDPASLKRKKMAEQAKAQTLQDLYEIGKARGYKRPWGWAKHIINSRQLKKIRQ